MGHHGSPCYDPIYLIVDAIFVANDKVDYFTEVRIMFTALFRVLK